MKLQVTQDGCLVLTLDFAETADVLDTVKGNWSPQIQEDITKLCTKKKTEWLEAIADGTTAECLPTKEIDLKTVPSCPNYDPDEGHEQHGYISANMWNCSYCGSPNTVSRDEGCTNCGH